jgi:hypothetical protein
MPNSVRKKVPKPKDEESLKKRFWDWSDGTMILVEVRNFERQNIKMMA